MFRKLVLATLACSMAGATENFESQPAGALTQGDTVYGKLTAEAGHAEINSGHGHASKQALRLLGGAKRSATLQFSKALEVDTPGEFWLNHPRAKKRLLSWKTLA